MFTATILGWLVLFAVPPPDCQQEKDAKKVKVTVVVILANECCDHVDPALVLIADEVRKKNPNLKGFTLASMTCDSLEVEKKAVFKLVDDKTAEIIIIQPADKNDRVVLAVKPPMQGPIVYRTVCGKFLPIVTRCQTSERILPHFLAAGLGRLCSGRPSAVLLGVATLQRGETRERLILAVRVQPCNGK